MLESPEARAKLRCKLESWPDDRKSPVNINQGLELLDMVERLEKENDRLKIELHDMDSSAREMWNDMKQLEKEANWLANKLVAATKMLANATGMETDDLNEAGWRKVAREAVESSNG